MIGQLEGRVLLLDNDKDVREAFRALLEHTGLDVYATSSLSEFLTLVTEHDPELVLVDVRLAGAITGDALASIIRGRIQSSTVVLFSGISPHELSERSRAAGADGYLSKMAESGAILSQVITWVCERRVWRATDGTNLAVSPQR